MASRERTEGAETPRPAKARRPRATPSGTKATGGAETVDVAVVGGGASGLFAAELLAAAGRSVVVFDRMPSMGRKVLLAGRSGLNLTHTDAARTAVDRYGAAADRIAPAVASLPPDALRAWAAHHGQPTFVGSSGRVFPEAWRATPLLRAWLAHLAGSGVELRNSVRWTGWEPDGALRFEREGSGTPKVVRVRAGATLLALGGATWPRTGSDGGWVDTLLTAGVPLAPLEPANCGVLVSWSSHFLERHEGRPLKNIAVTCGDVTVRGDLVVTRRGLEGGPVYQLGPQVRSALAADGRAVLHIDLHPDRRHADLALRLARPARGQSLANRLRRDAGLSPVAASLLREPDGRTLPSDPEGIAHCIKDVEVVVDAMAPMARAISTAGGVSFDALDDALMLRDHPGVFLAGEMLDWEAPTGGYLLHACFATAARAVAGMLDHLGVETPDDPSGASWWAEPWIPASVRVERRGAADAAGAGGREGDREGDETDQHDGGA